MKLKRHLRILLFMTAAWFLFWMGGLPDYYRQYSTIQMAVFDAVILPPLILIIYYVLTKTRRTKAMPLAIWIAFYMTVPLFLYDLIYCGYYLSYGLSFLSEFWYLTVYYVIPWLLSPAVGWWIDRRRSTLDSESWRCRPPETSGKKGPTA